MDRVLPEAPYRQWVLTFPWEIRFLLAMDRKFLTEMLRGFLRTLFAWQRLRGRQAGIPDGPPGAVTFVQRFGGILNLNPHFHSIFANRSRYRNRLPLPPSAQIEATPATEDKAESAEEAPREDDNTTARRARRLAWASLMRRVLDIDVLTCPKCAASMTIIAFLTDPNVLTKILDHLNLPSTPPPLAPARSSFDEQDLFAEELQEPVYQSDQGPNDGTPTARAPP